MRDVFIWIVRGQQVGDFILPSAAHNFVAHARMLTLQTRQCQAKGCTIKTIQEKLLRNLRLLAL
jgi:hypothetical protein